MFDYEIRRDFVDGTFDVATITADSIGAAVAIAARGSEVASTMVLCTIDRAPQVFLAW